MNKAYNPIDWVNNETPINETNLNKMSNGLSMVDDRVIALNKTLGGYSDKINEALDASVVAQEAKEIAIESAEKAEEALKNAEAVVGVGIATKDKAGLVKADDVHIESDGTLKFIEKTTSPTMPNSHKGRLLIEEIGGVCEQGENPSPDNPQEIKTVKGKNLLDCRGLTEQTINGVTFTPVYDAYGNLLYLELNGTATALYLHNLGSVDLKRGESYVLNGSNLISLRDSSGGTVYANADATYTTTENITVYCKLRVGSGESYTNVKIYPMIRPASISDDTYVPYGLLRVKTHGKNFFNAKLQNTESNGVNCTDNGDGTYTLNGTSAAGAFARFNLGTIYLNGTYKFVGCPDGGYAGGNHFGLNLLENNTFGGSRYAVQNKVGMQVTENKLFGVCIIVEGGYTCNDLIFKPMITKDLTDTYDDFASYQESSITLSSPIELCGIGDVQDVIDVENGVVRRRFKEIVFDGSEDEQWLSSSVLTGRYGASLEGIAKLMGVCVCTMAVNMVDEIVNHCHINTSGNFYINTDFGTLPEWKAFLVENPMTVIYELATEEVTDLPTADRIALNSLATYDGVTYLEWDCYLEPTHKGKYGTSEVGGYSLEGLLTGRSAELLQQSNADRITALETALINNV